MSEHARLIELIKGQKSGSSVPLEVFVELTHACNLRCRHCYLMGAQEPGKLSLDELKRLLAELRAAGTMFISFTGGEVLMRHDFMDVLRAARDEGLFYSVLTNGTLITDDVAGELASLNPTSVEISLYGAVPATHDYVTTRRGSFAQSVRALRLLKTRGVRTVIKTSVLKENLNEISALERMADELGAYFSPDPMIVPAAGGSPRPAEHRLSDDAFRTYMLDRHRQVRGSVKRGAKQRDTMCSAGKTRCAISPAGDVYPCVIWRMPVGNVKHQLFADLWSGAQMARIRSVSNEALAKCRACDLSPICLNCPGFSYLENKTFLGPSSEICRMTRVLAEVIGCD